ncbi:Cupin superfamily protein [Parafrankia irregularis]|uniref:Cupin superfamily protein n=1 Tax=Parafrankia irregularis TaxID=795642 RepID=A0A0S4R202_9ACTN|nr:MULTISPECIES: cupin domain-containing protein [Frankiaceae]KPM50346.1 hypothetical protein ACG83_40705 [Frankia sp. R43]MBE3204755.1 hypothetical protein [Parafrankia sp. CH37]CUU60918.1 Cupin superfamily protein [Parafrankia irregularis]
MTIYARPLDRSFWTDEFLSRTSVGTAPFLFKNVIPAAAARPDDVLAGFAAIRRTHVAGTDIAAHARVYVGEDRRDDLLPGVLSAPGWDEGGFVQWLQTLTVAERFSLVINNLETVSPRLAAGLGAFLASLLDGWGVPLGGAELVAFVGNYAGTAFGVHEGFEDAFLVHLGPNPKNFYTWSAEAFEKLTGSKNPLYGDYSWLLEHGEHFVLEAGDILFLPRRVFHVGTQDEFSVSVAVPLYTYPDAGLLREVLFPELFASLLADRGPDHELSHPSPMAALAAGSGPVAQRLTDLARPTLATALEGLAAAVEQHASQRWNTILSNGGWELVDGDLARSEAAAAFNVEEVVPGASVSVIEPYRMLVSGQRIFLRGYEIAIDASVLPPKVAADLSAGTSITLPEDENVLAAIRALGATGGLHVTTRSIHMKDIAA